MCSEEICGTPAPQDLSAKWLWAQRLFEYRAGRIIPGEFFIPYRVKIHFSAWRTSSSRSVYSNVNGMEKQNSCFFLLVPLSQGHWMHSGSFLGLPVHHSTQHYVSSLGKRGWGLWWHTASHTAFIGNCGLCFFLRCRETVSCVRVSKYGSVYKNPTFQPPYNWFSDHEACTYCIFQVLLNLTSLYSP